MAKKLDQPETRECLQCYEKFVATTDTNKFCGDRCRKMHHRQSDIVTRLRDEISTLQNENDQLKNRLKEANKPSSFPPIKASSDMITYYGCPRCCVLLQGNKYIGARIDKSTRKTINCPGCKTPIAFDGETRHFWLKI